MAKNRRKKHESNATLPMEISTDAAAAHLPQAMDTSEAESSKLALGVANRKIKKGVPTRRSRNLRKQKAMEKAIAIGEKTEEKISKNKSKISMIQSAKLLYD